MPQPQSVQTPPEAPEHASPRISVDLSKELTPQELEAFLDRARAAGRTPEEHFLAITIGKPRSAA